MSIFDPLVDAGRCLSLDHVRKTIMTIEYRSRKNVFFARTPPEQVKHAVLRVAHECWGPGYRVKRSRSMAHGLVYVLKGAACFQKPTEQWRLTKGAVACFGPGSPYALWCDPRNPLEVLLVSYHGRNSSAMTREHLGGSCLAVRPANPFEVRGIMKWMFTTACDRGPFASEICNGLLPVLLWTIHSGLRSDSSASASTWQRYFRCRDYIDQHFEDMLSVSEAAEANGISHAHMCRLFQRHAELTPHRYFMRLKMNLATELLQSTDWTVKKLAFHLGFSDPYVFSKLFKRMVGVAPKFYREK